MNKNKEIPSIIVSRLPLYLRALTHLQSKGIQTTSSDDLGKRVGVSAAQIRKDLSQFGGFGKQGTGYTIATLVENLRKILQVEQVWDVALIGMGDMGHALSRYQGFKNRGFRVTMVFDSDPVKVGSPAGGYTIQDTKDMKKSIREAGIRIAMLCVPAPAAQQVTDQLIEAGIKAILNYAPINLNVPADVQVQYIDPSVGLQRMTYYLE